MNIVYNAPPTASRFIKCKDKISFIKGPIGSGKSVACCMKIMTIAMQQAPGIDGVRRTRHIVVRNTRDQLKDTTAKTWLAWFPDKSPIGYWKETDRTYYVNFTPKDGIPVYSEIMFRALDDPADVAKVLSLEASTFFFNECREIAREIVENAIGRVGRYPEKKMKPEDVPDDQWPTFVGVFGDTNAPELDSYWYNVFEHLPVDEDDPNSVLKCTTFSQPAGDGSDGIPPENIENLRPGYYDREGRSEEWFRTMVQVKYAKSLKGTPVYMRAFKEAHRSAVPLKIDPVAPVIIGLDTARTPGAVFMQQIDGRIRKQREAVAFDMGAKNFVKLKLKPLIKQFYPNNPLIFIYDPSSTRQDNTDDNSWVKVLKKEFPTDDGHHHRPAVTNDPKQRILALDTALRDWPDGEPLIIYDPSLKWCIEGLRSKYRYVRLKGADGKMQDKPEKNSWSHIVEADQYGTMFLTGGQYSEDDYVRTTFDPRTQRASTGPADRYAGY